MKPNDPLTSPLRATALFGGVFLVALAINGLRFLLRLRPASGAAGADPPGAAMLLGWLAFAVASGVSVAAVRRRRWAISTNAVTGIVVGFFYAFACLATFGRTLHAGGGAVADVMKTKLHTVTPDTPTRDAIALMQQHRVGCLPVVQDGHIVAIVTEEDFVGLVGKVLDGTAE